ncbi:hotdog fold domain-containing protein [Gordonia westfalica]|uniref:Acyl-coenzyme A thioesterase PaaI, contains HGG motif n=1 Tax=Gordonia westfalica TaxID=158898 RepID=A0A1H2LS29_9ACTN|nr:hotdog fold domain-containing protein [Gordonia westfalica]MDS1113854.1 hotdog fold domain-containing protein [Gordonia westfalica]SDU83674.1 Acyl-coenzyme A thioesterase PaaI, contains HGG motif [Gordonia westfalica]
MSSISSTYALRKKLPDNALGNVLFSLGLVAKAPYFGTVLPLVQEMEPGYARVTAPNWFGVHNHIGTFHAIAACNLAEAAMGVLMEATTPTSHRWIPKAMQTAYLTKATTRLTAEARLADDVDFDAITTGTDVTVSVSIVDTKGVEVVHCDITTWVTPK